MELCSTCGTLIVTVLSPVQLTSGAYKQVSDYTVCDYLISFWNINGMPVNGALWFIRDLMVMLAFSPLVYWCLRYFRWYILVVLGCIWLVGGTLEIPRMDAVFFFLWEHGLVLPDVTLLLTLNLFFPWGVALYFLFCYRYNWRKRSRWISICSQCRHIIGHCIDYSFDCLLCGTGKMEIFLFFDKLLFFSVCMSPASLEYVRPYSV